MARAGWIADYKDPETFLGISRKASGNNYASYSNPEFEDLMNKAAAAAAIPRSASKLLSRGREGIGPRHRQHAAALLRFHNIVSPKLKGFEDNVMDVHPTRFIRKQ